MVRAWCVVCSLRLCVCAYRFVGERESSEVFEELQRALKLLLKFDLDEF